MPGIKPGILHFIKTLQHMIRIKRKSIPDVIIYNKVKYILDASLTRLHKKKKPFKSMGVILLQVFETNSTVPDLELIYVPKVETPGE